MYRSATLERVEIGEVGPEGYPLVQCTICAPAQEMVAVVDAEDVAVATSHSHRNYLRRIHVDEPGNITIHLGKG